MAIRKRISGNGPEDAAIRSALEVAMTATSRRIAFLEDDLKSGSAYDVQEHQDEIDARRKTLAVWKRLSSMSGKLRIVSDAEA